MRRPNNDPPPGGSAAVTGDAPPDLVRGAEETNARNAPRQKTQRPKRFGRYGHVFAALDLGSNNCRLLIARPEGRGFRVMDAFSRVVRLGEGVEATGRLSDDAMDRAVEAIKLCVEKMRRRKVTRARAIATEACRRAVNGADFIERVRRETGLRLDVITAAEEARLAVAGCAPLLETTRDSALVFDIGGGSTEIIWLDLRGVPKYARKNYLMNYAARPRDRRGTRSRWTSLPVGVVSLAERFSTHEGERDRFDAMKAHVADLIAPFAGASAIQADRLHRMQVLGTSGTITTLAGVHLELERYNRAIVDGMWMPLAALGDVTERLLGLAPHERVQVPCIGEDRAELVMSGAAILQAITECWPVEQLRIADRGLREGMLYALMSHEDQRTRRWRR